MMEKILTVLMLLLAFNGEAQHYFKDQYPKVWERAADYTTAVALQMPEEEYSYKPGEGSMGFGEQLLHIAGNIAYLTEEISGQPISFFDKSSTGQLGKSEIINILKKANELVAKMIAEISEEELQENVQFAGVNMTKENLFYLLRDHQVHHRGQCIVYLRMKKIKPPPYVGW